MDFKVISVIDGADKGSSLIDSAYYDGINVAIDFDANSEDYYIYKNVPAEIWNAFIKADSLGGFYNRYIKGSYASEVTSFFDVEFDLSEWYAAQAEARVEDVAVPADEVAVALAAVSNYYEVKVLVKADSFADAAVKAAAAFGEESVSSISTW